MTRTAPDTFAYINTVDGQMLLKDSLPIAIRDRSTLEDHRASCLRTARASISDLDKIADRINSQVTGVKATKPSDLVTASSREA